jgi:parallel beta-helix repeat protein
MRAAAAALATLALACAGCATGQTGAPTSVSHEGATISGSVVSDAGGQVEYWVEFGPTTAYGSEGPHQTVSTQQNTPAEVLADFAGGARSTVYHYRLCARDSSQRGGPGCGEDRSLKTQSFACGETLTSSVRLTDDVSCQTASGLVIGAAGILIDLNRHRLAGPINVGGGSDPAIDNSGGFDDVTIRNGSVGNFGDGIHLEDASRNRILDVGSFGPQDGIDIRRGDSNEVRRSGAAGRNSGLVAVGTTGLVVADGQASAGFGNGMTLSGLVASRIVRNAVTGGALCCGNTGISLAGNDNLIRGNRIGAWNAGNLVLVSGANNRLIDNDVFDGVFPLQDPQGSASNGDGLFVGAFTAGTVVRGNTAHDNAGDGIEVRGTATNVADNTADDNGDFGIDAVAGVTDGGGNLASGNGNPLQCRNVFCQ